MSLRKKGPPRSAPLEEEGQGHDAEEKTQAALTVVDEEGVTADGEDTLMATTHGEPQLGNSPNGVDQAGTNPSLVSPMDSGNRLSLPLGDGSVQNAHAARAVIKDDEHETDIEDIAKESAESSSLDEIRLIVQARSDEAEKLHEQLKTMEIRLICDRSKGQALPEQENSFKEFGKNVKAARMRLQAARSALVKKLEMTGVPPAPETPIAPPAESQREPDQVVSPKDTPCEVIKPRSLERQFEETAVLATNIEGLSAQMVKLFFLQSQTTKQLVAPLINDVVGLKETVKDHEERFASMDEKLEAEIEDRKTDKRENDEKFFTH